jgi:hypothetical protein
MMTTIKEGRQAIKEDRQVIKEQGLDNGLQLIFTDESNRYFGDYHRICVVATIVCNLNDLSTENSDDDLFFHQAIATLGKQVTVVKRFERMGVATADVEAVRAELIDSFLHHASSYLSRPEYPRALVHAELKKRSTPRYYA